MKKKICLVLTALCLALTAACGGGQAAGESARYELDAAEKIVESGAFSETLEEIDLDTAAVLYGVDINDLTGVKAYHSAGATAEETAVLQFTDRDAAAEAMTALQLYLADRQESYADYLPQEVPKLENALLEQKEDTILLVVAEDMEAARAALG